MFGRDQRDPLFIQVKEAEASVLEEALGPSEFSNHGQRVVEGQLMMQASSDIFLGWLHVKSGIAHALSRGRKFINEEKEIRDQVMDYFIGHLSWKRSWLFSTMVATVFSESWPSASFTTSCR